MKSPLSQRRPVGYYTTELSRYSLTPVRVPAGYLRVTCGVPAVYLRGTCGVPAGYLRSTCGVPAGYLHTPDTELSRFDFIHITPA